MSPMPRRVWPRRQKKQSRARLDYSKSIPNRVRALERLLENYPEWRGRASLIQITPKSRSDVKSYGDIEAEVTCLVGRVNGRFGDAAWTPIRYVNRSYSRPRG
jgi:trehalose 6-phosphate synthase